MLYGFDKDMHRLPSILLAAVAATIGCVLATAAQAYGVVACDVLAEKLVGNDPPVYKGQKVFQDIGSTPDDLVIYKWKENELQLQNFPETYAITWENKKAGFYSGSYEIGKGRTFFIHDSEVAVRVTCHIVSK
jgi:hypothetical protein